MTPEAQRIAIAEACGAEWWKSDDGGMVLSLGKPSFPLGPNCDELEIDQVIAGNVPDYLNDLNAMHAAEGVLRKGKEHEYADWLKRCAPRSGRTDFHVYHATAAQRAEAFLRTLNLWKD